MTKETTKLPKKTQFCQFVNNTSYNHLQATVNRAFKINNVLKSYNLLVSAVKLVSFERVTCSFVDVTCSFVSVTCSFVGVTCSFASVTCSFVGVTCSFVGVTCSFDPITFRFAIPK